MVKEKEDLLKIIKEIEDVDDNAIMRRIKHQNFAKTVVFLCYKFRTDDFLYTQDLANFFKISYSRAYQILMEFQNLNLIRKKTYGNVTEWIPVKNNDEIVIFKWLDLARKTLKV
jgi:hypothetical protein